MIAAARSATACEILAAWVTALRLRDIPPTVRNEACTHLLDGIGVALAGVHAGPAGPAIAVACGLGGPAEARPIGDSRFLSAPAAAFATAAAIHALDFDDTHEGGPVHPTAVVAPVALAVGQAFASTGAEVLEAFVAGAEIICRLGVASPHGFHARGLHATSVCGPLAAAAVAAKLGGLDCAATANAIAIAASSAGGLLEFLDAGTDTKVLHPAGAAMNGLLAARLAGAGAAGPSSAIEGRRGLYASLSDRPCDIDALTGDLGRRWETASIAVKAYPSCQLMHNALDAAVSAAHDVTAGSVETVEVEIHPDSVPIVCGPGAGQRSPRSTHDAKFDLPWTLAALLIDGTVTLETYTSAALERREVLALAGRVKVTATTRDAPAIVRLHLAGGETVSGQAGPTARKVPGTEVRAKFETNCARHPLSGELATAVGALADKDSLARIMDLAAAVGTGVVS